MRILKLDDVINEGVWLDVGDDLKAIMKVKSTVDMSVKTYHSKEIQNRAKVTESQLKHWTVTGVLEPYQAVKGTGKMHLYDHQNLIEAMICKELSQYSINFRIMKEILTVLREKKWTFKISFVKGNDLFDEYHIQTNNMLKEWAEKAPKGIEESVKSIIEILNSKDPDGKPKLDAIIAGIPKPRKNEFIEWINDRFRLGKSRAKALTLLEDEMKRFQGEHIAIKRLHTLWERFKAYPHQDMISLILWKNSPFIELSKPNTGDYNFYVTSDKLDQIISRCKSSIVIALSRIIDEAGSFYEEAES